MELKRATVNDAGTIWSMQREAFSELLDKYRDYETNPACETAEQIKARLL